MNGTDLLNGFHFIEDYLIEEAETKEGKKANLRYYVVAAASVAIVLTAVSSIVYIQSNLTIIPNCIEPPIEIELLPYEKEQYTLFFNKVDGVMAERLLIPGHFWQTLTAEQTEKILPVLAEKYEITSTIHYSHAEEQTSIFNIETSVQVGKENDVKITIAPNQITKCYSIDGKPILSQIAGIDIEAGLFITDANNRGEQAYIYSADFKMDDIAYYVEFAGTKSDEAFFVNLVADIILGGKADLSVFAHPVVPVLRDEQLTEAEAYAETDFGRYLPSVPNKYQWNSAARFINQDHNYLLISWSRGYDDIDITVAKLQEEDKQRIISVKDTELYDLSLYPMPWADSMPSEKAHIIENPIFKMEELTQKAVEMRSYGTNEQGDNGIKMQFSVLYGDVLVELHTEGVSAPYLYDALCQVAERVK